MLTFDHFMNGMRKIKPLKSLARGEISGISNRLIIYIICVNIFETELYNILCEGKDSGFPMWTIIDEEE